MNSHYLAQHLVNAGKLTVPEVESLLKEIKDKDPQLPLIALRLKMLSGDALAELDTSSSAAFGKSALEKGVLTNEELKKLHRQIAGETLRFAQVLLDEKRMSFGEIEQAFADYDEAKDCPVVSVVEKAGAESLSLEEGLYGDYMKLFMDSLTDFLHTPVIIDPKPATPDAVDFSSDVYEVSQRIMGDVSLVGGMMANEAAFLELARRYSQEDLTSVDDLAIDSMEEFFNVINGLFCINLAGKNKEAELGLPRWKKNVVPKGNQQLLLRICTDFGSFVAVLASDEFM